LFVITSLAHIYTMSNEIGKYVPFWGKFISVIKILLKKSIAGDQVFEMSKGEFEATGNKEKSGYSFNLEIANGRAVSNIAGSALARDLYTVLSDNEDIKLWLKGKNVKINMGNKFSLNVQTTEIV
jgi:hypothetical protein